MDLQVGLVSVWDRNAGQRMKKECAKSVAVSTLLSIAFTVVLTLTCCLLSHQILRWMQIPADISGEAYDYMFVVLLGTGATVFYNMISNMLRALGETVKHHCISWYFHLY